MTDEIERADSFSIDLIPSPESLEQDQIGDNIIINQIAHNLALSAQSLEEPLPEISSLTQPIMTIRNNINIRRNFANNDPETISNEQNQNTPENSQCIDLTKEQDDVLIITDSPIINRTVSRNLSRKTNRAQRTQANDPNDDIEVISSQRRTIQIPQNPNETIVIDDDRHDGPIPTTTRAADIDIVQICSPLKRQKTNNLPVQNDPDLDSENDEIPKCPLCLENLTEIKQKNKKLVATSCGHVLCNKCLDEYFKAGSGTKTVLCPTCRTKLTKSKMITLFL